MHGYGYAVILPSERIEQAVSDVFDALVTGFLDPGHVRGPVQSDLDGFLRVLGLLRPREYVRRPDVWRPLRFYVVALPAVRGLVGLGRRVLLRRVVRLRL